ncbi:MAG: tRNA 2-selenouridine(34) synthase MnmH [Bacillota bacterium]
MEIEVKEALERTDLVYIDVRSPKEYQNASIPGAINIPLFDDREHHQLGLIYHQVGEKEARLTALDMVAPKLPALVENILKAAGPKTPLLYCYRGGMRSISIYEVLKLTGFNVFRLKKGYKAYRKFINNKLATYSLSSELYVLHGLTGVGKTAVLKKLEQKGYPVIDLEGLAGHRGSVFGSVGDIRERSQKDFDALLLQQLERFKNENLIFIEGEGRRIGNVYLPAFLGKTMDSGFHILLTASLEKRIERILQDYIPKTVPDRLKIELEAAINSLRKRLGCKKTDILIDMLKQEHYHAVVEILCTDYYDLFYKDSKPESAHFHAVLDAEDLDRATIAIAANYKNENHLNFESQLPN